MTHLPTSFIPQQVWLLDPRDPAVLGDGRSGIAFVEGGTWAFPYPGTVAGMVRTTLLQGESQVSAERAKELLTQVRIRGPWLLEPALQEPRSLVRSTPAQIRVPAPSDVWLEPSTSGSEPVERMRYGCFEPLAEGEGAIWPSSAPSNMSLVNISEPKNGHKENGKKQSSHKLESFQNRHWPFSLAVWWNLGLRPDNLETAVGSSDNRVEFKTLAEKAVGEFDTNLQILRREQRMHVVLEDARGTAEAGQLFSSGGLRLCEGWRLALEVGCTGQDPLPTGKYLTLLGGESRPSYLAVTDVRTDFSPTAGAFPSYASFADRYQATVPHALGLRLQLLSPAFLPTNFDHKHGDSGWLPSWLSPNPASAVCHPALSDLIREHDLELRLKAVAMSGFVVVSGWNLQGGRPSCEKVNGQDKGSARKSERTGSPRDVRRLVPAGSVYYIDILRNRKPLEPCDLQDLLPKMCEKLWGVVIDPEGPGEAQSQLLEQFRAPAAFDGYGLILPGYWF